MPYVMLPSGQVSNMISYLTPPTPAVEVVFIFLCFCPYKVLIVLRLTNFHLLFFPSNCRVYRIQCLGYGMEYLNIQTSNHYFKVA